MAVTNIETIDTVSFKSNLYQTETIADILDKNSILEESIFTQKETSATSADILKEETDKEGENFLQSLFKGAGEFFSNIFKGIGNFFKGLFSKKEIVKELDINTKDGEIGYTKQSTKTGDCWVLAGINALSYTEEGRNIIKDALEYKDGYTVVHLKGAGDYIIKDKEVEATQYTEDYSSGDWDMVILELAIEKALDDIASEKVELPKGSYGLYKAFEEAEDDITGGNFTAIFYLITGKDSDYYSDSIDDIINSGDTPKFGSYPGTREEMLDKFEENNGKSIAIGADRTSIIFEPGTAFYTEDLDGNPMPIYSAHGYALKEVDGDNVTITNPWDSSRDIKITKETFFKMFNDYYLVDLSEDKN